MGLRISSTDHAVGAVESIGWVIGAETLPADPTGPRVLDSFSRGCNR